MNQNGLAYEILRNIFGQLKKTLNLERDAAGDRMARFVEMDVPGAEEERQPVPQRAEQRSAGEADRRESWTPSDAVPFGYRPMRYDCMEKRQRSWYAYWKEQVESGRYPPTDLGYVIVYLNELLAGRGWREAQEGYGKLTAVWMAYRKAHPMLNGCVPDWLFDFARLYGLEYALPDDICSALPGQTAVRDLLIHAHSEEHPLRLPFALIDVLCDYRMTDSRFYLDGHQELMRQAIPRVIALADAAMMKQRGRGLLALYGPNRARRQEYTAFAGADCPNANRRVQVSVKAYTASFGLRQYITQLVRHAENTLRALCAVKGRLRNIELDAEMAALVDAFLKREYAPRPTPDPQKRQAVALDFDSIGALRDQSNAVREALEVPEAEEPVHGPSCGEERTEPQRKADDGGTEALEPHKAEAAQASGTSDGLRQLLEALSPAQREALDIVLSGTDVQARLASAAEAAMTMPEMLMDEINDAAMQVLDDILIDAMDDTPRILEQYAPELAAMLKGER